MKRSKGQFSKSTPATSFGHREWLNETKGTAWSEEDYAALQNPKIQKLLKRGNRFAARGEWKKALPLSLEAWDVMPNNADILSVLAYGLMELGVRDLSIKVIERALRFNDPTPDLLGIIVNLSNSMGMGAIGEKVGRILIQMEPHEPKHFINLVDSFNQQQKFGDSVELLQATLPLFPNSALMWSSLGTTVTYRDGPDAALQFYEEALRLEPDNYRLLNNYAGALPDKHVALDYFKRAVELAPDHPEPRVGYSICQFLVGDLDEAHKNYAFRHDGRRSADQNLIYTHGLPEWQGQDPKGKTILITNEQGIGDEVLFMQCAKALERQGARLLIGCEKRLVKLFQRTFPDAQVCMSYTERKQGYTLRQYPAFETPMRKGELKIDYAIPMASIMRYYWHSHKDIPALPDGYLVGDPERRSDFRKRLDDLGPGLKIGFSWSSGLQTKGRKHYYPSLEETLPLLKMKGIQWVCLQYSQCDEELAWLQEEHGVTLHKWDDFDIKQDIDGNVAVMDRQHQRRCLQRWQAPMFWLYWWFNPGGASVRRKGFLSRQKWMYTAAILS